MLRLMLLAVSVAVVGGAVFLATWDIPPPTRQVERVVPDASLPR